MDRRSFIKLTAVTGTSAALASCGNPENQLIRFIPGEDIVPGVAVWKPSVCPLCRAGCGLTVRVMDAEADVVRDGQAGDRADCRRRRSSRARRTIRSIGAGCARAARRLSRLPTIRTESRSRSSVPAIAGDGRYEAISWDDAIAEVVSQAERARSGRQSDGRSRCLARGGASHRRRSIDQFLARFGAPATGGLRAVR